MNTDHRPATAYRAATAQDIDALRRLEQGVIGAERAFDVTLQPGKIEYYDIEKLIVDENVRFVVAERDRELIGCGFARIDAAKAYAKHTRQAYLGLMYVDAGFRRQSINAEILNMLKEWCRGQGVTELRLEVYCANSAAIEAYEKAGFSRHVIEMRINLEKERT